MEPLRTEQQTNAETDINDQLAESTARAAQLWQALSDTVTTLRRVLNVTVRVPRGQLDTLDDCYVFTEHQYAMLDKTYADAIQALRAVPQGVAATPAQE